ncbi:hypothetical protein [Enterococcus sp. AZ103]|uniref:hypothetical protein n=1 Tax=Enterococcus sp. AZ103 TaxID=2774628 RepID=UPI003F1EB5B1
MNDSRFQKLQEEVLEKKSQEKINQYQKEIEKLNKTEQLLLDSLDKKEYIRSFYYRYHMNKEDFYCFLGLLVATLIVSLIGVISSTKWIITAIVFLSGAGATGVQFYMKTETFTKFDKSGIYEQLLVIKEEQKNLNKKLELENTPKDSPNILKITSNEEDTSD